MQLKILEEIGLTKGEAKVYLTLLDLGLTTTGPIAKYANVAASKVYKILDKLEMKGLATYVLVGKTKHFKAADPEQILNLIREKKDALKEEEKKFQSILPGLKVQLKASQKKSSAEIYEGYKGLKTVFDIALRDLKKSDTLYSIGVPPAKGAIQRYFVHFYNKQKQQGFKIKAIYNESARKTAKERGKLTNIRFMPEGVVTPAIINVYGNTTIINVRSEEEQMFTFVMKSQMTADSFREYFNMMWNMAG